MSTQKGIGLTRVEGIYNMGKTRQATPEETKLGLQAKLLEECGELVKAPRDVHEYADVLQVLRDLSTINGVIWDDVHQALINKADDRGGFLDRNGLGLIWEPVA